MALHSEAVAKLAVAVIALAAALSVYSLGRLVFSSAVGLWAAAFFYTTPLVSWGSGTAYNDNAVAQFVTAAVVAFLLWYRTQQRGWIVAAGLLAGRLDCDQAECSLRRNRPWVWHSFPSA